MLKNVLFIAASIIVTHTASARDLVSLPSGVTCSVYSDGNAKNTELESGLNAKVICERIGNEVGSRIREITNETQYFLAVKVTGREMYSVNTQVTVVQGGNVKRNAILGSVAGHIWWYPGDSGYQLNSIVKASAGQKWNEAILIPRP